MKTMSPKAAVHAHEKAKHKGQPLTKLAKGGVTNEMLMQSGRNMARIGNQGPVGRKGK